MQLLFKERLFSWFDSYDIYDIDGNVLFEVKGELAWGHCFRVYDAKGNELGMVKQCVLTFLPAFEIYIQDQCVGSISKEFSLLVPKYDIDYMGWHVEGDFFEWDYEITDGCGRCVATVSKELFNWTDTYTIDVEDPQNALAALMLVLAIDAEKCSRNN